MTIYVLGVTAETVAPIAESLPSLLALRLVDCTTAETVSVEERQGDDGSQFGSLGRALGQFTRLAEFGMDSPLSSSIRCGPADVLALAERLHTLHRVTVGAQEWQRAHDGGWHLRRDGGLM